MREVQLGGQLGEGVIHRSRVTRRRPGITRLPLQGTHVRDKRDTIQHLRVPQMRDMRVIFVDQMQHHRVRGGA
jgi:hypothetical protein